jgi:hypothetical protein
MSMFNFVVLGRNGDGQVFSKPGGVIVSDRLTVSKCL